MAGRPGLAAPRPSDQNANQKMIDFRASVRSGSARSRSRSARGWRRLAALLLVVTAPSLAAAALEDVPTRVASPSPRVLIVSSFGRDFAFYSDMSTRLRSDVALLSKEPVDFYEIAVELSRFEGEDRQKPFADYLAALFGDRPLTLVVALGGPATRFVRAYRETLFPDLPVLYGAVDVAHIDRAELGPNEALVPVQMDLARMPQSILRLLPETRHLAIVIGASPLERFWTVRLHDAFQPLAERLDLIWLDGLSLDETLAKVSALPPNSAVYLGLLLVDGAGLAHSQEQVLQALAAASNAPIFGLYDSQVGKGVVGGPVMPLQRIARQLAEATAHLLNGAAPEAVRFPPVLADELLFDARELERWKIPESRLLAGSEVLFRPVSSWVRYRWQIFGGASVVGLQSLLIGFLLAHRSRRRLAEEEVRALHGRMLAAYEQERRRLARELHDDLTQRLARLAIDAAQVERQGPTAGGGATLRLMREELVRLSADVHTLSRQLHPSILEDLGLAEALRSEGERFGREHQVEVDLELAETAAPLAPETALCLFRVAQEALRNTAHHARASRVAIVLREAHGDLELEVRDDGVGFEPALRRRTHGLGHISLRERLHLVGGRLEIESAPGTGTKLIARVPGAGAAA